MNDDPLLLQLQVTAADRRQQVWERNSLAIDIWNEPVLLQKMNYIHNNPLQPKWKLADFQRIIDTAAHYFMKPGLMNLG